jgi:succinyl-diaminopimelate desuccinylase
VTFRAVAGEYVEVTLVDVKPPVDTADDHPFVQLCLDACRRETGFDGGPGGVAYYSDGAIIAPALGIPMVIIGPGEVGLSGAVDEYVEITKLEASTKVFRQVAEEYLS